MSTVPIIELNDGHSIPQLGFGVFQIAPVDTARAVGHALEVGYRHIDTAQMYGNERQVGEAVRASGLDRGDVFLTSKLDNGFHRPDDARRAFAQTLSALGSEYVDLFLIHWPLPLLYDGDLVSTWKTLEEFRLHPYFLNDEVRSHGEAHRIATEAWSPIAQGKVLEDPVIAAIAERLGRSAAQVVLRWHLQRDSIVFPKSTTPARIEENLRLFDFQLEPGDVEAIAALDEGEPGRIGPHPDQFAYVPG